MDRASVEKLYAEWREATELEGRAIANGDWPGVTQQQDRKLGLQRRIVGATEQWQTTWLRFGITHQDYERQFRPIIADLISLEMSNARLLEARRAEVEAQLQATTRATGQLRGLHRAYGGAASAHWTSYG